LEAPRKGQPGARGIPAWGFAAVLAALAVIPYLGVLPYDLVHDDRMLIRQNAFLASRANAVTVFQHDFWHGTRVEGGDLYRPLTILSIGWGVQLGLGTWPLRLTNLLLHALVAIQLARTLARLDPRGAVPRRAAWAAAAIFAVHPLASEAVIWINGRSEMMAALFGLLAFRGFVGLADREDAGGWRLAAGAAWFAAALFSKESALVWLVIAALWYAVFRRDVATPPRIMARRAAAYVAAVAVFLAVRGAAVGWHRVPIPFADNPLGHVDAPTRVVNAVRLLGLYLRKTVWPDPLSIDWAFDQLPVRPFLSATGLTALVLLICWIAVAWVLLRRWRVAGFLFCFFFAAFAITSNLLFPIGTIFGERLAYLPLAGICGLAGLALARLPSRRVAAALAAVAILAAAGRVAVRTRDFRSSEAIYAATVRVAPRAVKSLATLGQIRLLVDNDPEGAIPLLERAVEIWPDYPRPWGLLAEANRRLGRLDRAAGYQARAEEAAARLRREPP
jgi:tetratricopeptide (TPR) repeat protein